MFKEVSSLLLMWQGRTYRGKVLSRGLEAKGKLRVQRIEFEAATRFREPERSERDPGR